MQQNGENIYRLLLTRALRSSSTLQASRQADGSHLGEVLKHWQPKRSSEPSARPNEASQRSPSTVGCSWWRRKIVRYMNHISSLATRAFKFYLTNKSMKNPLTTHLLLALFCRLSFSNKPLHLGPALCIFLNRWSLLSAISIRFSSSALFSHYLLCQSHAAGLWKGGVSGVIFRCNGNTEGRVAWLEGERDRHNSAESCLKSEPQIFGSWLYTTLELPAPLRFQTHEIGNSIPPPRLKELERKGKKKLNGIIKYFCMLSESRHTMAGQIAKAQRHCKVRRGIFEFCEPTPRWFHSQQQWSLTWVP